MDNNLSVITPEVVVEILNEDTNSGVSRLDRIKINNPDLYNELGCPAKITTKLAEKLIKWSHNVYKQNPELVENTACEIKTYSKIIEHMILSVDEIDLVIGEVINYKYKNLAKLLPEIGINSKLTTKINNLKFLGTLYKRKNISATAKKFLYERLISEVFFQKSNIIIFEKNMARFENENFALGLLLYNIPANAEYELNFLSELRAHGIKF